MPEAQLGLKRGLPNSALSLFPVGKMPVVLCTPPVLRTRHTLNAQTMPAGRSTLTWLPRLHAGDSEVLRRHTVPWGLKALGKRFLTSLVPKAGRAADLIITPGQISQT